MALKRKLLLWRLELRPFALMLALGLLVGLSEGRPLLFGALALLGYLLRHLYYATELLLWLRRIRSDLPEGGGLWEELFNELRRLRRRYQRRKQQLTTLLEQFRRATDSLPDGAVVLNRNFQVEWFNRAAEKLLGLRSRDRGLRIDDLIRDPEFVAYLERGDFDHAVQIRTPSAEQRVLEIRIVPYQDGRFLLLAQDITRLKRLERQRRDFVARASHELKTPLTVLRGYLETLMETEGAVAFRPLLQSMEEQLKRLENLVADLLYLNRLETTFPKGFSEVDLNRLTERVIYSIVQTFPDAPPISVQIEVTRLQADGRELEILLRNLLANAVQYSPERGKVEVRWLERDGEIWLEVEDRGIGIPSEQLSRITERFYRTPEAEELYPSGTGLGLAIVKHILQRHGGRLEIESEPGRGSLFRCRFPARERRPVSMRPA